MKKNFSLSLPKPCSEKWNDFTPTSNGSFCGSCSKVVIDFTKMSDQEIIEFFNPENVGPTCGRFRPDQMKVYADKVPVIKPGFAFLKAGFAGLLFLLVSRQSFAQTASMTSMIEVVQHSGTQIKEGSMTTDRVIKGTVTDEAGNVVPGVNVLLKGSTTGTATDADGNFEFPVQLKNGDVLVFTFIGYKAVEIVITKETLRADLKLVYDDTMIFGEVAYDGVFTEKPSVVRRMWENIKSIF